MGLAESSKGFEQRGALDTEIAAHCCFGHATVQSGKHGFQFLAGNGRRSATDTATAPRGGQSSHDAFACQSTLILGQRAKYMEQ